jgi:hypothetical protein
VPAANTDSERDTNLLPAPRDEGEDDDDEDRLRPPTVEEETVSTGGKTIEAGTHKRYVRYTPPILQIRAEVSEQQEEHRHGTLPSALSTSTAAG